MSKGSRQRPVDQKVYNSSHDRIFNGGAKVSVSEHSARSEVKEGFAFDNKLGRIKKVS